MWFPVISGYWLVRPAGTETRREIITFRNWLLKEMAQLRWNDHSAKAVSRIGRCDQSGNESPRLNS